MKYVCLFLIAVISMTANGQSVSRYCGQALNDALNILCKGNVKTLPMKKFDPSLVPLKTAQDFYLDGPYFEEANKLAKTRRRRYSALGIYDECCRLKGCTIAELQAYCK